MRRKRRLKAGDIVKWTYEHHLNSRSSTFITKTGTVVKLDNLLPDHFAQVKFKGNKTVSTVLIANLEKQCHPTIA